MPGYQYMTTKSRAILHPTSFHHKAFLPFTFTTNCDHLFTSTFTHKHFGLRCEKETNFEPMKRISQLDWRDF
jgi:hypothetical protein